MNISDADNEPCGLIGAVLVLLFAAWGIVKILKRRPESGIDAAILETFRLRVRAWWILFAVLAAAFLLGHVATVVLFGLISFWALREFITLTPTRPGDHRTLFWVFFLFTPLQFVLVGMGYRYYGLYSIVIPVYAFLFVPARHRHGRRLQAVPGADGEDSGRPADLRLLPELCPGPVDAAASAGDRHAFRRRRSTTRMRGSKAPRLAADAAAQPADEKDARDGTRRRGGSRPAAVLLRAHRATQRRPAIRLVANPQQARDRAHDQPHADLGRAAGRHGQRDLDRRRAVVGHALPRRQWWMAAVMSAVIALMGFAGSITMSAIKRDRGVKDYGTLVEGHGGVLDRIDSICFAAPVFFHCTRWWLVLHGIIAPAG